MCETTAPLRTFGFVVGYDPGGDSAHGVAVAKLSRVEDAKRWRMEALEGECVPTVEAALAWIERRTQGHPLLAVGVDTLTEWRTGSGGWRAADRWLRDWLQKNHPKSLQSVVAPNALYGAMPLGGMSLLMRLQPRLEAEGGWITEAHPKVCYLALNQEVGQWSKQRDKMVDWLRTRLGPEVPLSLGGSSDHAFDAALSLLAAFRGLHGDWTLDLHNLPDAIPGEEALALEGTPVRPLGRTHYWWPRLDRNEEGVIPPTDA